MGSSNRRWPNMFKAKPCSSHHQWQRDISPSLISSNSSRSPYTSVGGMSEEIRTPEPRARWNPKPEQIRILEDIFNSGMVNPPRDEIPKIRAQLQEYGQVGDANIFYWFQNRKSRSKHKLRRLQNSKNNQTPQIHKTYSSSPSSTASSDNLQILVPTKTALLSSLTDVGPNDNTPPAAEPLWFPMHDHNGGGVADDITERFFFSGLSNGIQAAQAKLPTEQSIDLLGEIMYHGSASKKEQEVEKVMKMQPPQPSFSIASIPTAHTDSVIEGAGEQNAVSPVIPATSTVVIHGVAYEMPVGPLNLREEFGDGAVLMDASGQPMLTNSWGVTLCSLQPSAFYYLIYDVES